MASKANMQWPPVRLVVALPQDRARVNRLRPPRGLGPFVHYNWFWLDRAAIDRHITFALVRGGSRARLVGCVAYGPHEVVDLDPSSRLADVGDIYHLVIDRRAIGRGYGTATVGATIKALRAAMPSVRAVRVNHHPDNVPAIRFFERLGFVRIGQKIDGETGARDVLRELQLE